jgi:hypothetical protein
MTNGDVPVITPVGKHWWESKTLWFNAITFILGVAAYATQNFSDPRVLEALTLVTFVGNLVLRIWFTDKPIA